MIIEKPDWVHHSVEDQSAGACYNHSCLRVCRYTSNPCTYLTFPVPPLGDVYPARALPHFASFSIPPAQAIFSVDAHPDGTRFATGGQGAFPARFMCPATSAPEAPRVWREGLVLTSSVVSGTLK